MSQQLALGPALPSAPHLGDGEPPFPADAVEVARIVGSWGVKGGLKVKAFSSDPQALFSTKRWFLKGPEPSAALGPKTAIEAGDMPTLLRVVQAREQGEHVVATVQGLDDRDAANALRGCRIFVSRASFPTPADDEFYWVDLIGLSVRNREDIALGTVAGLVETGPTCVLRVLGGSPAADRPEERLIPFVAAYVDRVDLAGRCVHVDWPIDY